MTDNPSDFAPDFRLDSSTKPSLEEYGRFQQHLVLLEDAGRIERFRSAIDTVPAGDVVIDVGAGTGVLGLLSLIGGFQHAILIEPSRKMSAYARHLAALNGLSDRVTIVTARLEDVDFRLLPTSIDMVISETLSSVIFGFGSWDFMSTLVDRLRDPRNVIPSRGRLLVAPTSRRMATRGPDSDGLSILKSAGLTVDLFERTFRSAGNIYDKAEVALALANGTLQAAELASFDFGRNPPIMLDGVNLAPAPGGTVGIVLFWDVQLAARAPDEQFTNLDPLVTSWYPYYIEFTQPIETTAHIQLQLVACDAPYTYAFRILADCEPVTNVLYW
ncbi:class I SAM-dependent methyltransferase [Paraburkholderia lycopersici]|uniref:rRNA small subunit methyltransferase G n=1 Tax=Paraburkholderia lycopersici TaxID=416944 RepID=A0A1G6GV27_9BURK|nr:class I SAM-dependent methyltransferase [Paraburkholderia lycopersici]SDB85900.1 rRNA small subunit methyltransferase G [Paraburkholderia lycopersici]